MEVVRAQSRLLISSELQKLKVSLKSWLTFSFSTVALIAVVISAGAIQRDYCDGNDESSDSCESTTMTWSLVGGALLAFAFMYVDVYIMGFYTQNIKLDNIGGGQERDGSAVNSGPSAMVVMRLSGLDMSAWLTGKTAALLIPSVVRSTVGVTLGVSLLYIFRAAGVWKFGSTEYTPGAEQIFLIWIAGSFGLATSAPMNLIGTIAPLVRDPYSPIGKLLSNLVYIYVPVVFFPTAAFTLFPTFGEFASDASSGFLFLCKCLFCLHPVLASGRLVMFALTAEVRVAGQNLSAQVLGDDVLFSAWAMVGWLLFDLLLWSSVFLYVESIIEDGGNKNCCWCISGQQCKSRHAPHDTHLPNPMGLEGGAEDDDLMLRGGIMVRNLRKVYGGRWCGCCCCCPNLVLAYGGQPGQTSKPIMGGLLDSFIKATQAVKDVSCSFPAGQITALLGHNGAGKSTLINCVLGSQSMTDGTVTLAHPSVAEGRPLTVGIDNDLIYKHLRVGYVPQGDALDHTLSPEQTLTWYATLRGMGIGANPVVNGNGGAGERASMGSVSPAKDTEMILDQVVNVTLQQVGLDASDVRHTPAKFLSGGQKRRLAIGIALLGDPLVMVMDEPTEGVDAMGKREIRKMIKKIKARGTTVVLTTHAMEEAEALADRTVIVSKGRVIASGSTARLKAEHGLGYYLHIALSKAQRRPTKDQQDSDNAWWLQFLQTHVPDATLLRRTLVERVFILPLTATPQFPSLLRALDSEVVAKRIPSFGLEMATLEEVFIRLTEADEAREVAQAEAEHASELAKEELKLKAKEQGRWGWWRNRHGPTRQEDEQDMVERQVTPSEVIEEPPKMELVPANERFTNSVKAMMLFAFVGGAGGIFGILVDIVMFTPIIAFVPQNAPLYICILNAILLMMVLPIVSDLQFGRRTMMVAMGLQPAAYWGGTAALHMIVSVFYALVWGLIICLLVPGQNNKADAGYYKGPGPVFVNGYSFLPLFLLIFVTATETVFIGYVVGMLIPNAKKYSTFTLIFFMASFIEPMLRMTLPSNDLAGALPLTPWTCIIPFSAASQGAWVMRQLNGTEVTSSTMLSFNPDEGGIGPALLLPILGSIILIACIYVLERRIRAAEREVPKSSEKDIQFLDRSSSYEGTAFPSQSPSDTDPDRPVALTLQAIQKTFLGEKGRPSKTVLKNVSLQIQAGELVGLLGPNGAGKSTLLRIISGEQCASRGDVMFGNHSVKTEEGVQERNRNLYIAQQHNESLNGKINPLVHLGFYASIKGVPFMSPQHKWLVQQAINLVQIDGHKTKQCARLSGGTQRKVCAAIALLGPLLVNKLAADEEEAEEAEAEGGLSVRSSRERSQRQSKQAVVALLDEVSAGVDVSARRGIWEAISSQANDISGLLCTHHLEEAESLCETIVILVNGVFCAAGTPLELKARLANQYKLNITVACDNATTTSQASVVDRVKRYVEQELTGGRGMALVDESTEAGRLEYDVFLDGSDSSAACGLSATAQLAHIFESLEETRAAVGILDYALAQPTLEQVFLNIIRDLDEETGDPEEGRETSAV